MKHCFDFFVIHGKIMGTINITNVRQNSFQLVADVISKDEWKNIEETI